LSPDLQIRPTTGEAREATIDRHRVHPGFRQFVGWHDSQRNEDCSFSAAPDGTQRCMPDKIDNAIPYYSDAACTKPIALRLVQYCSGPNYVWALPDAAAGACLPQQLYPIMGTITVGAKVYAKASSKCSATTPSPGTWVALGPVVDYKSFVAGTVSKPSSGARLVPYMVSADDGAVQRCARPQTSLSDRVYDTQRAEDYELAPAADGLTRCLPLDRAQRSDSVFSDANCTQPAFQVVPPVYSLVQAAITSSPSARASPRRSTTPPSSARPSRSTPPPSTLPSAMRSRRRCSRPPRRSPTQERQARFPRLKNERLLSSLRTPHSTKVGEMTIQNRSARARPLNSTTMGTVLALAALGCAPRPNSSAAQDFGSSPAQFVPLLLDGGGTMTMPALSATGALVLGGDVEGFFRSSDFGDHWLVSDTGLYGQDWRDCASIQWSKLEPETVYACVGGGAASNGGGFLVSTDGGKSWTMRSTDVQFHGNHPSSPLPAEPRSTGNLLAQDSANGRLYVNTYDQGVFRSSDLGKSWTPIGLNGDGTTKYYGRSLAIDSAHPNTLYAAMYKAGLWKTTDAQASSPLWKQLSDAPANVEEIIIVSGALYAASGSSGLYRSTDGGATWISLNGSFVDTTQSYWKTLAGYVSGTSHVIIADCDNPIKGDSAYRSLIKLTIGSDGNVSYADLTRDASKIDIATIPPDNRTWWHADGKYQNWLGGNAWQDGFVVIDPSNPQNIYVSGAGGFFRSTDGGSTWTHPINGLPIFVARDLALDPNDAKHVVLTTSDWTSFDITDGIAYDASTTHDLAPAGGKEGFSIAFDPVDSTVFLGTGAKYTNAGGMVYSRPSASMTWTDTGFGGADRKGDVALGLAVGRDKANTQLVLAAVMGSGIWRKGEAGWEHVDSTIATTYAFPTSFSFALLPGSSNVYAFDRWQGIFRSTDYGKSWTPIWGAARGDTDERTGFVALNPAVPDELWVSAESGLYKIAGANVGTVGAGLIAKQISAVASPGGLAIAPSGVVYVITLPGAAQPDTGMLKSDDGGATWSTCADDSLAACASRPGAMHMAANGQLYIASDATVACHGRPE
jgi:hypothetical protein